MKRINIINKKIISTFALISLEYSNKNVFKQIFKKRYNSRTISLLNNFLIEKELKPAFIYENLHLDDTRNKILKDTKNLGGIYLIFNNITGDYYVGSASTNRFNARLVNHLIYFKGSKILKNAVRKYKLSNFIFLILEVFPEVVTKENNKKLLDLEDFYLKYLLPNYNILTEAGSNFGYKHTELDRIKMKTNYSTSRRDLIGNLNKGKAISLEIRKKMKQKALIIKKRSFTPEGLLNMKKTSKAIILYNLDKTVFGEYPSIVETAKKVNCSVKTIIRALKTEKRILKKRFIVEYKKI
jgi:group I intron endonuclease